MRYLLFGLAGFVCSLSAFEYQVQFENEQICVAKAKIMAHEEVGLHRDIFPQIVVALKGGTITRLEADGTTTEVLFPTGQAVYRPADTTDELHRSVNKSQEPVELIIMQLKKG